MSRIGQKPVEIPEGVELNVNGQDVKVKGKLGELGLRVHDEVSVKLEEAANDEGASGKSVVLAPKSNSRFARQIWPTMRSRIHNMVQGVSEGFSKKLELHGVGYRANMQGQTLVLSLGLSHEVRFPVPEAIQIKVENQTEVEISGADKQKVGQIAAKIRAFRPPEPYKGKGIRYAGEYIFRKEGKKK